MVKSRKILWITGIILILFILCQPVYAPMCVAPMVSPTHGGDGSSGTPYIVYVGEPLNVTWFDTSGTDYLIGNMSVYYGISHISSYTYEYAMQNTTADLVYAGDNGAGFCSNIYFRAILIETSFTSNVTSGVNQVSVQFNDTSTNDPIAWNWSFNNVVGNNTDIIFSTSKNASHTFGIGNFSIQLNITNTTSYSKSQSTYFINVTSDAITPVTNFTSNITGGYPAFTVFFNDTSNNTPIAWNWSFGDGTFSEDQNATHIYNALIGNAYGAYTVSLNASNAGGFNISEKANYITSYPLNASFTSNITTAVAPSTISFTDLTDSGTANSWNWSFGDGNYSDLQNPTHNYTWFTNFTVTLNASNSYTWDVETKSEFIHMTEPTPPTSSFTSSFISGSAFPQEIQFTDASAGIPTEWNWSFIDLTGNATEVFFSQLQNPSHTFNTGNYSIHLNTSNYLGYNVTPTPQFINMTAYTVSMTITDAVTTVYIGNSVYVIVDSTETYTTNTGLLNITVSSGNHTFQTTSNGYVTNTQTINVVNNTSVAVALTATSSVSGVGYYYPPTSAQIQFFDQYYRPLSGMYVTLTPINTTTEGNWTILKSIYGISETSAYSPDDPLSGMSDAGGLVIFPSIKPVYYRITATRASDGLSYDNYIQIGDERRTIILNVGAVETAPLIMVINSSCSLSYDNESTSWATFSLKYNDSVNSTTMVMAYIEETKTGAIVDQQFFNDTSNVNYTASFLPTKSLAYKYGYTAVSTTYGVVNESRSFAGRNYVEPYQVSTEYKLWIAVVLMVVIGAVFSAYSVKFGAVVLPLTGFFFSAIGWISYGAAGVIILPVLIILGLASYIRKKENEIVS